MKLLMLSLTLFATETTLLALHQDFEAKLRAISQIESGDNDKDTAVAPPPLNSRTWRHPTEIADAQRQVEQCLANVIAPRPMSQEAP